MTGHPRYTPRTRRERTLFEPEDRTNPITLATRPSRAKHCQAWERYDIETNGIFVWRIAKIAARYPKLTPNQLRVAALATGLLPSHEIARILGTTEFAVNKVRCRIRKVLGLRREESLENVLLSLVTEQNNALPQMGIERV